MSQCLNFPIDKKVLGLLPKNLALDLPALPLQEEKEGVRIALEENHSQQTVDDLAFLLGKPIIVEKYPSEELLKAIGKHYDISDAETGHVSRSSSRTELISAKEDQNSAPVFDGSIIPLVNRIVSDAIQMGASDIHVEPYEKLLRIRYRLDGALHDVLQPSLDKAKPLISRLKIMADLDIAEKRRPQDGRIRVRHNNHMIDIRVSTLPTDFGEKVVLRILDKSNVQLDLKKIGFEEEELEVFKKTIKLPYGMVLVTGPTGSGKTTTLYSALTEINSPDINITTIEDPIEYNLQGINQTHVRADIGLTFAATLRSILRQDPDVVMLGEIRDAETAEIAIRAALTGHLVFSTLHTNDAPSAITRLIDMGIEPFLVASSVKLIMAQRLLRKLCDKCKKPIKMSKNQLKELGIDHSTGIGKDFANKGTFYKAVGCPSCNNFGYKGRTAVIELFPIKNSLEDMIARRCTASEIREKAKQEGMKTLREAALVKAFRGETSLEEVIRETAG